MGYRWLYLPLCGAFALSLSSATPARAQERPYGGIYSDTRVAGSPYDNGYRLGAREGQNQARAGQTYDVQRDDAWQDADWGFRSGDKDLYRREFRRGYEAGYNTAYRRFAPSGYYETPAPPEPPPPTSGYVVSGHGHIAYENGYRDGMTEGSTDFRKKRPYEPIQRDRFRDADHNYDSSYGDKEAYRIDYRAGFRAGYDAGYPR